VAHNPEKRSSSAETKDEKTEKEKPGFRTVHTKEDSKSSSDNTHKSKDIGKDVSTSGSVTKTPKSTDTSSPSSSPVQSKSSHHSPHSLSHSSGIKPTSHPLYSGIPSSTLGYPGLSMLGHGINPELAAAYHQSQLLAQSGLYGSAQHAALKANAAASMNPYVSFTRVRTPSGATTLVPVCKDPYCTNCQLTMRTSHTSTTCKTPGCSQCAHEKTLLEFSSGSIGLPTSPLSLYPHLASLSSSASGLQSLSSLHSLYSHSALPSAHQGLPYICNWVAGHDYCGKRFNSSEELMQHLRSHTSSIDSGLPAGYGLGLPPSALSGAPGLGLGAAPISPNSLRRAYPTSLSPGLLSSSRFHPYKSPLGSVGAPPSGAHLPPLSAYYPQYSSLYGPRLGAAVP
ncbi:hypothetical protein LOTGIDRAFT_176949, partial [Lottia gigantea]